MRSAILRLGEWLSTPKAWGVCGIACFIVGWIYSDSPWGGILFALSAPMAAIALFFLYGMVSMADGAAQVLATGLGLGAILVISAAIDGGIGPAHAIGLITVSLALVFALRALACWLQLNR